MATTQANQVTGWAGYAKDGSTEQYITLQDFFDSKIVRPSQSDLHSFTLVADADVYTLKGSEVDTKDIAYIDGSSSKSLNGGIPLAKINTLGTASLDTNIIGGTASNIVPVYNTDDDEVLTEVGKKFML